MPKSLVEDQEQPAHPIKIKHVDHFDELQAGRLINSGKGEKAEHRLEVSKENPAGCHPHECQHDHGADPRVPHGDHDDYLFQGRLHHPHGSHCDDHGAIQVQ